jgi:hypothetical protein
LPSPEAAARVARHRGCTPEAAELLIVDAGKNDQIKARGVIESQSVALRIVGEERGGECKAPAAIESRPVSPLPAAWNGTVDLAAATMKPPDASYRITNVELCFIDLIAAGLLPAPPERARVSADEAISYLVKDVPLPWKEWQGAGTSPARIERAEIDLGEAIGAGVPAWGRPSPFAPKQPIPAENFHADMIEAKVPRLGQPKVVVRIDGAVGTSPPQRSADYKGPPWSSIEVDFAALRQARPRPAAPPHIEPVAELASVASAELLGALNPGVSPVEPPRRSREKKRSRKKTTHQGAQWQTNKRVRRQGPDRFGESDRALFPEMTKLMKDEQLSVEEAAGRLGALDKIKGRGNADSRKHRLAKRYRDERGEPKTP